MYHLSQISGFHPGGPGSTRGMRTLFFSIAGAFRSSFFYEALGLVMLNLSKYDPFFLQL